MFQRRRCRASHAEEPHPKETDNLSSFPEACAPFRNGVGWWRRNSIKAGQGVQQAGSHQFAAGAEWKASLCCRIPVAPTGSPPAAPWSGEGCQCEAGTAFWRGGEGQHQDLGGGARAQSCPPLTPFRRTVAHPSVAFQCPLSGSRPPWRSPPVSTEEKDVRKATGSTVSLFWA